MNICIIYPRCVSSSASQSLDGWALDGCVERCISGMNHMDCVCMYAWTHACMYIFMYAPLCANMFVCLHMWMYAGLHAFMHGCMYAHESD